FLLQMYNGVEESSAGTCSELIFAPIDASFSESVLKAVWHHPSAILCCSLKAMPVFTFANQSGLDMLETTLVALQDMTLEKVF
ncbi:MEKHLA domain-containing protein, partial [Shewanella sp. A3A]|nr:MEKHLA domain-containing protein [Shewanella ferrihydritica]